MAGKDKTKGEISQFEVAAVELRTSADTIHGSNSHETPTTRVSGKPSCLANACCLRKARESEKGEKEIEKERELGEEKDKEGEKVIGATWPPLVGTIFFFFFKIF